MQTITVFNTASLDGYFVDAHGEMNFAREVQPDPEWDAFTTGNATGGGWFLFGRVTYELMASYWPTPAAKAALPQVAATMNKNPKYVFSRTLKTAAWNNTHLLKGDLETEVRKLKEAEGPGLVIFGSGTIVTQLAQAGLIDEYQVIVTPVVLGQGRTMFAGLSKKLALKLTGSRNFGNGNVWLRYVPA